MQACKAGLSGRDIRKNEKVGGRLSNFQKDGSKVDAGPTLLLMPWVLNKFFEDLGRKMQNYIKKQQLHPTYRIRYEDGSEFCPDTDTRKMIAEIEKYSKTDAERYSRYLADYKKYYEIALKEFIEKNFDSPYDMLSFRRISALLSSGALKSVYAKTWEYFSNPKIRIAFSLQSVYIGAAPTKLPAVYGLFRM
ncbi:MAG: hypothetical protein QXN37_00280 [Candidatus Anstonellaceae archaeon]